MKNIVSERRENIYTKNLKFTIKFQTNFIYKLHISFIEFNAFYNNTKWQHDEIQWEGKKLKS